MIGAVISLAPGNASGHGLGADRAVLRLSGDTAYLVATPSVSSLPFVDRDRDGTISRLELSQFKNAILHRYGHQFLVLTPLGDDERPLSTAQQPDFYKDVRLPHTHGGSGATYVRLERRWKLARGARDAEKWRVQWSGAHRSTPLSITLVPTSPGRTIAEERALAAPQTFEFLRASPSHVYDFGRPRKSVPSDAENKAVGLAPSGGISPAARQFGLLVAALLMALGLTEWKRSSRPSTERSR